MRPTFRVLGCLVLGALALSPGCGGAGAPSAPGDSGGGADVTTRSTALVVTDVVSGTAAAGVTVSGTSVTGGTTNAAGAVTVSTPSAISPLPVTLSGAGFVTRSTGLRFPGPDAAVTLIPSSFDLTSFNEMFRQERLMRWTSAPPVALHDRVLQFNATEGAALPALSATVPPADRQSILDDLAYGLPLLTGDTFRAFPAVTTLSVSEGDMVNLLVAGRITVAWCRGLLDARGAAGLSRWLYEPSGQVTGGMICLDADRDAASPPFRRGVRVHELGHALGYLHVTARTSIMNITVLLDAPTAADVLAARVAFQRPPGNVTPDTDPAGYSPNRQAARWSAAIR